MVAYFGKAILFCLLLALLEVIVIGIYTPEYKIETSEFFATKVMLTVHRLFIIL